MQNDVHIRGPGRRTLIEPILLYIRSKPYVDTSSGEPWMEIILLLMVVGYTSFYDIFLFLHH